MANENKTETTVEVKGSTKSESTDKRAMKIRLKSGVVAGAVVAVHL